MMVVGRSRRWRHRSVVALMNQDGGRDPEAIIRTKARDLVCRAKGSGWLGPPFDPFELASFLGIEHQPNASLFSAEAQLTPLPDGHLLLEYHPEQADVRRNFSICHEIVHTFFPDCFEVVSQRKSNPGMYRADSEVEVLCQIGAAELLMPAQDFLNDLAQIEFSMRSVRFLSDRYVASREAILRRMIQMGDRPAAAAFLSRRLSPKERRDTRTGPLIADLDDPLPKMRILYAVCSPTFPIFLPPHKSVSDDSCVYSTSEIDDVVSQRETWKLDGFDRWQVEAMSLPVPLDAGEDTPAVVALILPQ